MQAAFYSGDDHNPRPIMCAALIFIILSFVIGIPLVIIYYKVYYNNDNDNDDDDDNDDDNYN